MSRISTTSNKIVKIGIFDSGTTYHMTGNINSIHKMTWLNGKHKVEGISGSISPDAIGYRKNLPHDVGLCYYVKDLTEDLYSVGIFTKAGASSIADKGIFNIKYNGMKTINSPLDYSNLTHPVLAINDVILFNDDTIVKNMKTKAAISESVIQQMKNVTNHELNLIDNWHTNIDHIGMSSMITAALLNLAPDGISAAGVRKWNIERPCLHCLASKLKKVKSTVDHCPEAKRTGEVLHIDLRTFKHPNIGGVTAIIYVVDEYSGNIHAVCLQNKSTSHIALKLIRFINVFYRAFGHSTLRIHGDAEKTLINLADTMGKEGISVTNSTPEYYSQMCERYIQTIDDRAAATVSSLIYHLPKSMTALLLQSICNKANMFPGKRSNSHGKPDTPDNLRLKGRIPRNDKLIPFGTHVMINKGEGKRNSEADHNNNIKQLVSHGESAICVGQVENSSCDMKFLLKNGSIVHRRIWKAIGGVPFNFKPKKQCEEYGNPEVERNETLKLNNINNQELNVTRKPVQIIENAVANDNGNILEKQVNETNNIINPSFKFYDTPETFTRLSTDGLIAKETLNKFTLNADEQYKTGDLEKVDQLNSNKILMRGPTSTHTMVTRNNRKLMDLKPASASYIAIVKEVNRRYKDGSLNSLYTNDCANGLKVSKASYADITKLNNPTLNPITIHPIRNISNTSVKKKVTMTTLKPYDWKKNGYSMSYKKSKNPYIDIKSDNLLINVNHDSDDLPQLILDPDADKHNCKICGLRPKCDFIFDCPGYGATMPTDTDSFECNIEMCCCTIKDQLSYYNRLNSSIDDKKFKLHMNSSTAIVNNNILDVISNSSNDVSMAATSVILDIDDSENVLDEKDSFDGDDTEDWNNVFVHIKERNTTFSTKKAMDEDAIIAAASHHKEMEKMNNYDVFDYDAEIDPNAPHVPTFAINKWKTDALTGKKTIMSTRLTANGKDFDPIGDTSSSTADFHVVQMMRAAIIAHITKKGLLKKLITKDFDINGAFLHIPIKEDVFVILPKDYPNKVGDGLHAHAGRTVKLNRTLYGLKMSNHEFMLVRDRILMEAGFRPLDSDSSIFVCGDPNSDEFSLLFMHVDDGQLFSTCQAHWEKLKNHLEKRFGDLAIKEASVQHVGITFNLNPETGVFTTTQEGAIINVLKKLDPENRLLPAYSPSIGQKFFMIDADSPSINVKWFQKLVGILIYFLYTRHDIRKETVWLAGRAQKPTEQDLMKISRVYRYLKFTSNYGPQFDARGEGAVLYAWPDASFNIHPDGMSHTGFLCCIGKYSAPFMCYSRKQKSNVALSSMEAEYYALGECARNISFYRRILEEAGFPQQHPTQILEDNKSAIFLVNSPVTGKLSKHIELKHHYTRALVANGEIEVIHVNTEDQRADMLTKTLTVTAFQQAVESLMNNALPSPSQQ